MGTPFMPQARYAIAFALIAFGVLGCTPAERAADAPPSPPSASSAASMPAAPPAGLDHVVVVLIDTLRADRLGCYGYRRNTSPAIDRLAGAGVLFEEAWSPSSYTREAVSSLFSGRYPSRQPQGAGWCAQPGADAPPLAALFRGAGYATALISASPMIGLAGFAPGFDTFECMREYNLSGQGAEVAARGLAHLDAHRDGRSFTYLHVLDPHAPYEPPDAYYLRFAPERYPHPLRFHDEVRFALPERLAEGFGPGEARFEDMATSYDAEIAWVDDQLRALFEGIAERGLPERTLVVVTSDHGEEFLEHGYVEHAWKLYPETQRVPLIFWAPGRLAPGRAREAVSTVNLRATLLALAGIADPDADGDGYPLFRRAGAGWAAAAEPRPIVAELQIPMRTMMRTVVFDGWQYVQAQQWLAASECAAAARQMKALVAEFNAGRRTPIDPWGATVHEELYHLAEDPGAQRDRAPEAPPALEAGRALLAAYRARCAPQTQLTPGCDAPTSPEAAAQQEALSALGYIGGDAALAP